MFRAMQRCGRSIGSAALAVVTAAAVLTIAPTEAAAAGEVFVDIDATGANDGTSWADAYTDLQDALAGAASGDPVWVAEGVYIPDASDRTRPFAIGDNAQIYGGFNGTETVLNERDPDRHPSILSGDLLGDDDTGGSNAENSFTVVDAGSSNLARLDGLVIEGGNANGVLGPFMGPTERLEIDGPAIFAYSASNLVLANLVIRDHASSGVSTGAVYFELGGATIVSTTFDDNGLPALGVIAANVTVRSSLFSETGGRILTGPKNTVLPTVNFDNVTVASSGSVNGGGVFTVTNSIVWPSTITGAIFLNSNLAGGTGSNISVDPQFIDPTNGNYRLLATSPSVGAGDNALVPADSVDADSDGDFGEDHPDLDLGDRIIGTVDQGAYEGACPALQFVDIGAGGANDGTSWADAFTDLQSALAVASDCDFGDIWVAEGSYFPTTGSDRSISFLLTPSVRLFGGFDGSETSLSERDPAANATVLSGDIGTPGSVTDNSYHVVISDGSNSETRLDGFTVTSGRASGSGADGRGAGIQIEDGGSPVLANLIVRSNVSNAAAGGISLAGTSAPLIISSVLRSNSTQGDGGNLRIGANADARIANTVISEGVAEAGAGVSDNGSSSRFENVTIGGNDAAIGGTDALQTASGSDLNFDNSIVWDVGGSFAPNGTVTYRSSNVEGSGGSGSWDASAGVDGGNNIDDDPLFAGPQDFGVLGGSPSIDAGDQTLAPPDSKDIDDDGDTTELIPDVQRAPRLVGPEIDQGAFESASCPAGPIYVDADSTAGAPDGSSWSGAFPDLHDGLQAAAGCGVEVWVTGGRYVSSTVGDTSERFIVGPSVTVIGGFQGGEASAAERQRGRFETVLSGDLDGNDVGGSDEFDPSRSDNAGVVVELTGANTRLDSVTVSGGNSTGGSGVFGMVEIVDGSALVINSRITDGRGVNSLLIGGSASATVLSTVFIDTDVGLTVASSGSSTAINSEFIRSGRITTSGAADLTLVNPTIVGGSFQANSGSTMTIDNAIARSITAIIGLGTITWSDSNVEDSGGSASWDSAFGTDGGDNIDADPLFVDPANDRYRLSAGSPSLDAGDTSVVPVDLLDIDNDGNTSERTPDVEGLDRVVGPDVDHGASEGACPTVFYVDAFSGPGGEGLSWVDAFDDLALALEAAARCSAEVWVAAGTYLPDGNSGDRSLSFDVASGVELYGGFDGTETNRDARAPGVNQAILSGDLNGDGAGNDNDDAYTVLVLSQADPTTVVDGFVVTEGDSDGSAFFDERGGGIVVNGGSPSLANLFVVANNADNRGGGIYIRGESTARLTNVIATENSAGVNGGGIWVGDESSPVIANVILSDNLAEDGGGLALANGSAYIVNSTITDNTATAGGGGVFAGSGSHEIVNSIVFDNNALSGPADVDVNATSLEWASSSVEGSGGSAAWTASFGVDGGDNVDLAPDFVAPAVNDFRLSAASPLIDLGDTAALPLDVADLDRDGDAAEALSLDVFLGDRVLGLAVDLGALEGAGVCPASGRLYVDASNNGPFNGLSWPSAFDDLQVALAVAATCPGLEVWVADGTYLPTSGSDRLISFVIPSGTQVHGGFAGGETLLTERDSFVNVVSLSGDLDGDEQPANNSLHVVRLDGASASTVFDGFTINDGNASGTGVDSKGGGVLVTGGSPLLANLGVVRNQAVDGGGVAIIGGSAQLVRSVVRDNVATGRGGGVRIEDDADVAIVNSQITDNTAEFFAAGLHVLGSNPALTNLTVAGNVTVNGGVNASGGIEIDAASAATLTNVITFGNVAPGAGRSDLMVGSTSTTTSHSIVGSNAAWNTVLYGSDGGNNLFVDPQFEEALAGNYDISGNSPAIDSGSPAPIPADIDDLDADGDVVELTPPLRGGDRVLRAEVDRGAYEAIECQAVFFVDTDATGADTGETWTDAVPELRDALTLAEACPGTEVWVAEGTYLPADDGDRSISFEPIDGVAVYGGFNGTETVRNDRSPIANATILSGDLLGNDTAIPVGTAAADRSDNALHVVDASGLDASAVLDGFVISGGNSDAATGFDPGFRGGGVLIDGGTPTLTGNVISNNSARRGGGVAVLDGADPDVSGTVIEGNRADFLGGGLLIEEASPHVVDVEISNNLSDGSSGGVHIIDGDPILRRVSVSGNEALGLAANGGGIGISPNLQPMDVTIVASEIFLNRAPNGGGIAVSQSGLLDAVTVTIASSAVVSNEATSGVGGGLFATDADLIVVNTGVGANSSSGAGGAIFHDDGVITMVNSTVVGNESAAAVDGIRLLGSGTVTNSIIDETTNLVLATVTTTSSLIVGSGGSGAGWTLASVDGGNNIDADPLFVDAAGGDLHLMASSPAIDAGATALAVADDADADADGNVVELGPDLDLLARLSGSAVDLGAYEFGAPPAPAGSVFTPVDSCVVGDSSSFGPLDGLSVSVFQITGTLPLGQGAEAGNCDVPVGATAVLVNVAAKNPLVGGNLRATAEGVPASGGIVNFSALSPSLDNSNAVVVPLSASGAIQIEVNCGGTCVVPATDARLTVLGFYDEASGGADEFAYVPVTPCAAFDSRSTVSAAGSFVGPYDAGEQRTFQITGAFDPDQGGGNATCGVPAGASAVMVNLVAIQSAVSGDVAIGAGGTDPDLPVLSHAPLSPAMNNANAVIVPLDASGRLVVEAQGSAGAIDMAEMRGVVLGYLTAPASGAEYFPVTPCAAFDSRTSQGSANGFDGPYIGGEVRTYTVAGAFSADQGGGNTTCGVPIGADAVLVNLVAVLPSLGGNLRVAATGTIATGGVVNFAPLSPAMNNSNAVIVPISALGQLDVTANLGAIVGVPGVEVRGVILGYLD